MCFHWLLLCMETRQQELDIQLLVGGMRPLKFYVLLSLSCFTFLSAAFKDYRPAANSRHLSSTNAAPFVKTLQGFRQE